jgi:hypothetical protein
MPLAAAIVPAVVSAGTAVYSANQQKKAAKKANAAQQQAAQQQLQLQREQFDRVQGLNQPFINGGYAAFDQLLSRLGVSGAGQPQVRPAATTPYGRTDAALGPTAKTSTAVGGQSAPAGPDWNAYLQQNPDVVAAAAAEGRDPVEYASSHYEAFGRTENRALPMTPSTAYSGDAGASQEADPNAPPDYMNMARPEAPDAPTFQRPEAMEFRDYGDGPQFMAPTWQDIEKDPGFQWELKQGLGAVNAASAARGKLRSGDAAKALQREGYGIAHSKGADYFNRALQGYNANRSAFQDTRNFGTGLTQWQQNRGDNVFADDRAYDTARWQDQRTYGDARFDAERNYQTGRYDNDTNNLFRVTGIGTGAAGNVSGAGAAYANNAGNIFGNQAEATAQAAQQRAAANAGMVGAIGGAVGNVFANWGGGVRTPTAPNAGRWTGQMGNWGF